MGLLTPLLVLIGLNLLINGLLSASELCNNVRLAWLSTLHPWVCMYLFHCWPLVWIQMKHLLHKVLELFCIEIWVLFLQMCLPENVSSLGCQASVEWIIWLCSCEWWML